MMDHRILDIFPLLYSVKVFILCTCELHLLIPNSQSIPPHLLSPWQSQACSLYCWLCFCFIDKYTCVIFKMLLLSIFSCWTPIFSFEKHLFMPPAHKIVLNKIKIKVLRYPYNSCSWAEVMVLIISLQGFPVCYSRISKKEDTKRRNGRRTEGTERRQHVERVNLIYAAIYPETVLFS